MLEIQRNEIPNMLRPYLHTIEGENGPIGNAFEVDFPWENGVRIMTAGHVILSVVDGDQEICHRVIQTGESKYTHRITCTSQAGVTKRASFHGDKLIDYSFTDTSVGQGISTTPWLSGANVFIVGMLNGKEYCIQARTLSPGAQYIHNVKIDAFDKSILQPGMSGSLVVDMNGNAVGLYTGSDWSFMSNWGYCMNIEGVGKLIRKEINPIMYRENNRPWYAPRYRRR